MTDVALWIIFCSAHRADSDRLHTDPANKKISAIERPRNERLVLEKRQRSMRTA